MANTVAGPGSETVYTWEEIKKHTTRESGVWVVINDHVYDVSSFMLEHPGGGSYFTSTSSFRLIGSNF